MTPETAMSPSNIAVLDEKTHMVLKTAPVDVHATQDNGSARYWIDSPPEILSAVRATQDRVSIEYSLSFENAPNIDVTEVMLSRGAQSDCGPEIWTGRTLFRQVLNEGKSLLHYRLIQEDLAGILFKYNAEVSDLVLGLMLVALFWEIYLLGLGLWPLYTQSDKKLLRDFERRHKAVPPRLQRQGAEAIARADFEGINRRLIFAKTMGPAFGFLLTVSSLSAALHPANGGAQDTLQFVTAIEVAVVATFVGLAIRIAAQFGQRVYRDLTERQLVLLTEKRETER